MKIKYKIVKIKKIAFLITKKIFKTIIKKLKIEKITFQKIVFFTKKKR